MYDVRSSPSLARAFPIDLSESGIAGGRTGFLPVVELHVYSTSHLDTDRKSGVRRRSGRTPPAGWRLSRARTATELQLRESLQQALRLRRRGIAPRLANRRRWRSSALLSAYCGTPGAEARWRKVAGFSSRTKAARAISHLSLPNAFGVTPSTRPNDRCHMRMTGESRLRRNSRQITYAPTCQTHQIPRAGNTPLHQSSMQCRPRRSLEFARQVSIGNTSHQREVVQTHCPFEMRIQKFENVPKPPRRSRLELDDLEAFSRRPPRRLNCRPSELVYLDITIPTPRQQGTPQSKGERCECRLNDIGEAPRG